MISITEGPIDPSELFDSVTTQADGAVTIFNGVVRNESNGNPTKYLIYEAYPEMAEAKMMEIAREVKDRWSIDNLSMLHRIGRIEIGEISVCIAVSSIHREEAFAACKYAIDRVKEVVPIWKKEVGPNGEYWVEGPERAGEHV